MSQSFGNAIVNNSATTKGFELTVSKTNVTTTRINTEKEGAD